MFRPPEGEREGAQDEGGVDSFQHDSGQKTEDDRNGFFCPLSSVFRLLRAGDGFHFHIGALGEGGDADEGAGGEGLGEEGFHDFVDFGEGGDVGEVDVEFDEVAGLDALFGGDGEEVAEGAADSGFAPAADDVSGFGVQGDLSGEEAESSGAADGFVRSDGGGEVGEFFGGTGGHWGEMFFGEGEGWGGIIIHMAG